MTQLVKIFLKLFFRNPRAWFFVIFLPTGLFLLSAFLSLESIIRTDLEVSYRDFLLVGIIAMALMQTGLYTVGYLLIDYKRLQVLKRLFVTPLVPRDFVQAQIVSRFLIALLQVAILSLAGWLVFDAQIKNFWIMPILVFVGSTLFLNFGVLIAAMARDYEEAAPYTTMIGLPLVFLGDVFFPIKNLPDGLIALANFLPLKPLSVVMRYYLLGLSNIDLTQDLIVLAVWLFFTSWLALSVFEKKIYR